MMPRLAMVAAVLAMTACESTDEVRILTGEAMGTTYRIKTVGDAEGLRGEIDAMFDQLDRDVSTWREDSWISRFNRAEAGSRFDMPASVVELMSISRDCHERTEGRFDPTVGALIRLWGFGAWKKEWRGEPGSEEIMAAREACGFRHIRIDGHQITKLHGGLMLDFSAIAKGHAVDLIAAILREAGIRDFVIEIGGDLLAEGHAPGKSGWTVDGPALNGPVTLIDEAIATSGSEHHFRGQRSHIIDPRRGEPVPVGRPAAARARTCAVADALATAAVVEQAGGE